MRWILMLLLLSPTALIAVDKTVSDAIKSANREIAAALVAGSAERYAAVFTRDGSLLAPGVHLKGREQILAQQRQWFGQVLVVKAELLTQDLQVHGDVAHEVGTFHYTFQKHERLDSWSVSGQYLAVWQRQPDGQWKLLADAGLPNPESK